MPSERVASFAWQLQHQLKEGAVKANKSAGIALSPISLYIALGLALNGSGMGSPSEQELYHLLHQDKSRLLGLLHPDKADSTDVQQLTDELSALCCRLSWQDSTDCQLFIASGIFTNRIPVQPQYAQAMLKLFQAKVEQADSVDIINAWAAEATKGLIKEAVPPGTPFDMVLTNAVYFKGMWDFPFDKAATADGPFTTSNGQIVQVPMMTKTFKPHDRCSSPSHRVVWAHNSRFTAIRLPYKSLLQLGLRSVFDPHKADFSRLSDTPLFISDILQSVCVIVDEAGTEAAVVTAVMMLRCAAPMPPPVIRLDRSFLFMLTDDATGTLLFVTMVVDPSQSPAA
eukprot:gene10069-10224_t